MALHENLQEQHKPIDIRIVELLLTVIPESWYSIRLDVSRAELPDGGEGFPMTISNIEGKRDTVVPPDELYDQIIQHSRVFATRGRKWKKLVYEVKFDERQEDWSYSIDFQY